MLLMVVNLFKGVKLETINILKKIEKIYLYI